MLSISKNNLRLNILIFLYDFIIASILLDELKLKKNYIFKCILRKLEFFNY